MDRTDETVIPPDTPWLHDAAVAEVCRAVISEGNRIYFVGGCVRNAIMGVAVSDIDLSTDARPEAVMTLAERAGLRAVPTGITHGTITIIAGGRGFEVTTFRRDVETDGRRAVVAFSDDIADDARRRDFTMNAIYAEPDGRLVDPLGGMPDLLARRVRFIDNAEARIREDYLRILRYFRFHAWYGNENEGFDAQAIAAISANVGGIERLAAERVGAEFEKLLSAPNPTQAVAGMRQTGALAAVLAGADDRWLGPLVYVQQELGLAQDWLPRLASLGGEDVARRLRLSRADAKALDLLTTVGYGAMPLAEVAYRHGEKLARQALVLRAAVSNQMPDPALLETLATASVLRLPVSAKDLLDHYQGPALGRRLANLEQAWIASGFTLGRDALLDLPDT